MDIGPMNRVGLTAPVTAPTQTREDPSNVRQIVTAIRGLNKSELLGQNRELAFVRDPSTQRPVIQIRDQETGEVIDQIPPETVLRMQAELEKEKSKGGM